MPITILTENLIVLLAFFAALATALAFLIPFMKSDPRKARLEAVAQRRRELVQQQRETLNQQPRGRRQPTPYVAIVRNIFEKLKLENLIASPKIGKLLMSAGWRQRWTLVTFASVRFGAAFGLPLLGFLFLALQKKYNLTLLKEVAIIGGLAAAGFYLPLLLVKNIVQKRQDEMTKNFPDSLDLLQICVESGLSIEAAFNRVTEEITEKSPILAEEFGLMTAELAYLGDRRKAYSNFVDRSGLAAAKALSTALSQADKYGTSIAVALRVLATESRESRMAKAEKKAGALPAQLTVPMILFFLPALFLVILGPVILRMMKVG